MKKNKCISLLLSCCLAWLATASAKESTPAEKRQQLVSNVDTSLEGAQKYVLRVKGMPFYMTNIQVRLDLLRYSEGYSGNSSGKISTIFSSTDKIPSCCAKPIAVAVNDLLNEYSG